MFSISQILLDYKISILEDRDETFLAVPLGSGRKNEQEATKQLRIHVFSIQIVLT